MAITEYGSDTTLNKLEGKNWVATLMLCWFLGGFGGHRFYTGKTGTAWAMTIMTLTCCLAPITFIWALIDGFQIALGNWTHEDGSELFERINWLGIVYIICQIFVILYVLFVIIMQFGMLALMLGGGSGAGY